MDQSPRFLEAVSFPQLYRAPTLTGELTAPKKKKKKKKLWLSRNSLQLEKGS